jgi:diguanylate cyclase (GGDEF)-like protein
MRVRRPTRRRTRRLSLLVRVAIISFALLLAVGLVLGRWLGSIQRERSLDDAVKRAQIVAEGAFQATLTPADLQQDFLPITPETRQQLDDFIGAAIDADSLVRLKVWNAQHWIVYSDNPVLIGRWFPGDDGLARALDGEVSSLVTDLSRPEELEERDFGRLLAVYVPLRETAGQFSGDTGTVIGAFEIYVPYAPVAAAIDEDTRTLYLVLAIGLVVLYLALFRLVAGASRRLRVQAQENAHQATHDALTDLPNRRQLIADLQAMLDRRYGSKYVALALVDIDRFKEINDALGHPSGDTVLQAIADRFRDQMPDATVARIGGDEFAIAAENLPHAQAALAVATRIEDVLHDPFEVAGISVSVRPSIGIAMGPDDGRDADELLQHADVAMYVAKRTGSVRRLYSRNLDHYSPDRLSLAGELRDAIATASGEVHLAFQPKLDLRTDEVRGVECLVRWKHPQRGFIPPAEFLPIIENTELIAPLTWFVLDQALSTCASWRRHGLEIQMAVNISARTIGSPELYERVVAALETHGLPPSALELELTENALLGDHSLASSA